MQLKMAVFVVIRAETAGAARAIRARGRGIPAEKSGSGKGQGGNDVRTWQLSIGPNVPT